MRRALPLLFQVSLGLWLGLLLAAPAGAQMQDPLALTDGFQGDVEERAALVSADNGRWAQARAQAEAILRARPDSFIAAYVLGLVHAEAEGNLARSLYLLRQARGHIERQHGVPPESSDARSWHRRILLRESIVLGHMDRRADQLAAFDMLDAHYAPKQTVRRIWPLLKLGRFEEARVIGRSLIHDPNPDIRERAYNGLMAVEEEAGNRKPSYEWGQRSLESLGQDTCILATNTALGARRAFDFPRTITYDQRALKADDRSCPTSPHAQLSAMYLVFGQFQQSLSALKALRAVPRPPDLRVQNEMVIRARFVELLLALGQLDEAEMRVREILAAPDRAGMISAASEIVELSNALLGYSVLTARYHQLLERSAARTFWDAIRLRLDAEQIAAARWRAAREATRLAALPETLHKHVRPYYTDVMPWYGADMLAVFGAGVMRKAIAEVRAVETDYPDEAGAFLDAYLAELRWREGARAEAIEAGEAALRALPEEPRLLRNRIRAWIADSRWRTGDGAGARQDFAAVMEFEPAALRHLGLALPVAMGPVSGARGAEIADRLRASPRLDVDPRAPFEVSVSDAEGGITICVQVAKRMCGSLAGPELEAAEKAAADPIEGEPPGDVIAAAIDRFHDEVFAPRIELTQSDINSLDGRAVRQSARDALDGLLGPKKTPGEER